MKNHPVRQNNFMNLKCWWSNAAPCGQFVSQWEIWPKYFIDKSHKYHIWIKTWGQHVINANVLYVYELSFPLEKVEKQTKRAVNTLFIKLFDFSRWKAEFF